MPVQPKVSALVLNWRDNARTQRCVGSLLESTLIEHVLVVDNDSSVDSDLEALLKELDPHRVEVLQLRENRGFAGGVNPGLSKLLAEGYESILVINNDATINPRSVESLLAAQLAAPKLTLVGPRIVYPTGDIQAAGSRIHWFSAKVEHCAWPGRIDYLTWACVLLSKDIISQIGLLDEKFFMYWEDADYSLRLTAAGGQLVVIPEAVAVHEESATKKVIGNLTIRYATASLATFAHKYPKLWVGALYRLVMRAIRQSLRHGFKEGSFTFQAWKWGGTTSTSPAWQRLDEESWAK